MVSTRNSKDKFVDGERVLCYEPDATKAKVLYDSKVLEVKYLKDKRGRKAVYYLIHFHGWNPSWDRLVSEDYILKDTEKNRKLQRDLAAKARLNKLGAYLYRSDASSDGSNLSDKAYEAGNSCSSQDVASAEDDYLTATDDDKESAETDDSWDNKVPLRIPPTIRMLLEHDAERINTEEKLMKLPASPTIIQILEMYVRHFCKRIVDRHDDECPRSRNTRQIVVPPRPMEKAEELEWVTAQVNLVKEVVQGLRICFDFYCCTQLLYDMEQPQFNQAINIKQDASSEDEYVKNEDETSDRCQSVVESADVERRRSLRSHRDHAVDNSIPTMNGTNKLTAKNLSVAVDHPTSNNCSTLSSSSVSSLCGPTTGNTGQLSGQFSPEMAKLLSLCDMWHLVPDTYLSQLPRNPSSIYGATHLARLFVKLPLILFDANLPESEDQPRHLTDHKLKLLLHHLQAFLVYLDNKSQWFGDEHYFTKKAKTIGCLR